MVQRRHLHAKPRDPRRRLSTNTQVRLALALVIVSYLGLTFLFSWWTPAGEANDELDHVQYIEYIMSTGSIPHIALANGHESHQPPLFYLLGAGWQELLGAHPFHLSLPFGAAPPHGGVLLHNLAHSYTPTEHHDAVIIHELRYLSVLLGLGTVLLTYKAGALASGRRSIGVASAGFVALLPKEIVVSSSVTNDALVIFLGSLSLVLLLAWIRQDGSARRKHLLATSLGLTLGAAVLTKFNALPLVATFLVVMLVAVLSTRRSPQMRSARNYLFLDPLIVVFAFLLVTGWWFIRNQQLYGDLLAQRASNAYLKQWLPPLIQPVSWLNSQRFLHFVPSSLFSTGWYDGGWNQLLLPKAVNEVLWVGAAFCIVIYGLSWLRTSVMPIERHLVDLALIGSVLAGLLAVIIVAKDSLQAEGRVTYVALSAFSIILVLGSSILLSSAKWKKVSLLAWPCVLLGVDLYVLTTFVYPGRGL